MTTPHAETPAAHSQDGFLALHAETRGFTLGRPTHPQITADGTAVLFLRSGPRDTINSLYEYDIHSGTTRELVSPSQLLRGAEEHLSSEERARRERMRVSARGFTGFQLSRDGQLLIVQLSGRLYAVQRKDAQAEELPTGAGAVIDPQLSPDSTRIAYVRERDLYLFDLNRRSETRLTHTTDPKKSCGLAEFVAQEELDRFTGFWWSPDSQHIAYEASDNADVEQFHLADPVHPERDPDIFYYPRPGKNNARVSLWVISLSTPGKSIPTPRPVNWDANAFPYLSQVSWYKGGPLTVVVRDRQQTEARVLAWDDATAQTRTLVVEKDPAWLNVDKTLPRWLPDGSGFLWSSDASGTNQLQLRAPDGHLVRALSPAGVEYVELRAADSTTAFYLASSEPTESHLFRAALDGQSPPIQLTHDVGQHSAEIRDLNSPWLQYSSTLERLPSWSVMRGAERIGELPSVAIEPPFIPQVELTRAGARELRAIVVRPRNFDPHKKYPVMVDVYGGPHHKNVVATLATQLLRQWIADHGYIVLAADGRGTPNRGRAFERALKESSGHGSFGDVPLADQVDALQSIAHKHPEMDLSRVGIYGWSFGGYLSALAVLRRPDVFHVAVAGAPVVDWRDYDTAYTERYLDTPQHNQLGYDESSLLTYAKDLARPLLLIHGTTDDNVYFLHSLKLADALFRAGRDFELLPLQGFTHMVPDPQVRQRLYDRVLGTLGRVLHP